VQAYTFEARRQALLQRDRLPLGKTRIKVRSIAAVIVILLTFSGVVGVLWIGACGPTSCPSAS
jgi:ATP-binding cassette subfamily B protein